MIYPSFDVHRTGINVFSGSSSNQPFTQTVDLNGNLTLLQLSAQLLRKIDC